MDIYKIFLLISFSIFIFLFIFYYFKTNKDFKYKEKIFYVKNFSSYISILSYYMDKAYPIIYKKEILTYSLYGTKLELNQIQDITKKFISLTCDLIGNNLYQELILFYGNKEALYKNIAEYFYDKYENDEIRETTQQQLMKNNSQMVT